MAGGLRGWRHFRSGSKLLPVQVNRRRSPGAASSHLAAAASALSGATAAEAPELIAEDLRLAVRSISGSLEGSMRISWMSCFRTSASQVTWPMVCFVKQNWRRSPEGGPSFRRREQLGRHCCRRRARRTEAPRPPRMGAHAAPDLDAAKIGECHNHHRRLAKDT
jgi:hypothetical protein